MTADGCPSWPRNTREDVTGALLGRAEIEHRRLGVEVVHYHVR
jgi:hypothetical protein